MKNGKELKNLLLEQTTDLNFNELAQDIGPFLINGDEAKRVQLFREYIQSVEF